MQRYHRVIRLAAVLAAMATFALMAVPASANGHGNGQGAEHETFSVVGDVFDCGEVTYEIIAGDLRATFHEGESAPGNTNFTGTGTPKNVVAESSDGRIVNIRGALWFGATMNAQQDTMQGTFTGKLQFVEKGKGTVENINMTFHVTVVKGEVITLKELDLSSCQLPE